MRPSPLQKIQTFIEKRDFIIPLALFTLFLAITLPSLRPALVPAIILSVVWTFNAFNVIYLVSAGEPAHSPCERACRAAEISSAPASNGKAPHTGNPDRRATSSGSLVSSSTGGESSGRSASSC